MVDVITSDTRESTGVAYARMMSRLRIFLSEDFLGGPRWIRLASIINLQKGGTLLFVGFLMIWFDNFSTPVWVYLALHGTYGLCWLLKHMTLPDPRWDQPITIGGAFMSFVLVLGPYWIAPYLLISGVLGPDHPMPSNGLMAFCIALHTLGVVLMIGADAQKYFTLQHRPGLITTGFFKLIRHPNYLGEMMLYAAYAALIQHWIPWSILLWIWVGLFLPNMLMKERSLSRYPAWAAYKARTGLLLPRLFSGLRSEQTAAPH